MLICSKGKCTCRSVYMCMLKGVDFMLHGSMFDV